MTLSFAPSPRARRGLSFADALTLATAVAIATTALAGALPSSASADAAAEARFHDERARRHYAARRYDEAVQAFMVEQRLAPNPNIVFNIALCFEHLARREEAYSYFAEYLSSGDDDEERLSRARAALDELRPRVALIEVNSTPPGAAIYVDRRELGQYGVTPRVLALPAGEHHIWLETSGYRRADTQATLVTGEQISINLTPDQILGRLRVTAAEQAQVRVFDAEQHLVREATTPMNEQLPPGTYQVVATIGRERWSEPLIVRAEQTTEARAALQGPTGEVTVTANMVGALVSLDGRERGFTPQVLTGIPVGERQIQVTAEGMRPFETTLEIAEDDHAWMTVEMNTESQLNISPALWVSGGLTLALAAAAGITTGFAADSHAQFQAAQMGNGANIVALGEQTSTLNLTSDILWLSAGLALVTSVVLFFTTSDFEGRPSRGSVTRSAGSPRRSDAASDTMGTAGAASDAADAGANDE